MELLSLTIFSFGQRQFTSFEEFDKNLRTVFPQIADLPISLEYYSGDEFVFDLTFDDILCKFDIISFV